jgi:hypothetical protein
VFPKQHPKIFANFLKTFCEDNSFASFFSKSGTEESGEEEIQDGHGAACIHHGAKEERLSGPRGAQGLEWEEQQ